MCERDLCTWKETYAYVERCLHMCEECYKRRSMKRTINVWKRPVYVKRDLYMSKETCVTRDLHIWKETYRCAKRPIKDVHIVMTHHQCEKRPMYVKRDQYKWKETCKRDLCIWEKRPIEDACIYVQRGL